MSARTPSRRLLQSGTLQCLQHQHIQPTSLPTQTRRTFLDFFSKKKSNVNKNAGAPSNPVLEEYMKRKPSSEGPSLIRGDLASSSIFDADRQIQEREAEKTAAAATPADKPTEVKVNGVERNPATMAAVLDPRPGARERWERKMVIKDIKKGNRLTGPMFIKRTEREISSRSHNFKTSTKKLGMLARQIAGKTVDEAIVQMRYSKKKVAQDVLAYLEYSRDEAIVKRGMGLGSVTPAPDASETTSLTTGAATPSTVNPQPLEIQLKDGKRHKVTDKSKMYIDQAWVGRGPYGKLPEYRAKGKLNIQYTPWTSLSVVLKEEATRVREFEQREAKRLRKRETKVWHPLPNRPIVGQRQWFSW